MITAFIYDGPIYQDCKNQYYSQVLNNEIFSRYLEFSNLIHFATRVVKTTDNSTPATILDQNKIKVISMENLYSFKNIFKIKSLVKRMEKLIVDSDLLIARLPSVLSLLALSINKKIKKKVVIELVGCPWDSYWNHSIFGKFLAPIMWLLTKKSVKKASNVIYVSNYFLQRRYPTTGNSVNCSNVNIKDIFDNRIDEKKDLIYQNLSNKYISICTAAAIDVKYKGQATVVKAIKRFIKAGYNVKYHLIGGGDPSRLKKIAKRNGVLDSLVFYGSVNHRQVLEIMSSVDFYIQSSKQEGLPRSLIEGMSVGCLCLGSNAGGIPELLDSKYIFHNHNSADKFIYNRIVGLSVVEIITQLERNKTVAMNYKENLIQLRRLKFIRKFVLEEGKE